MSSAFRLIPSVDRVLADPAGASGVERFGRERFTDAVRLQLDRIREAVRGGLAGDDVPAAGTVASDAASALVGEDARGLRSVFNLTGTLVHTNLGRALLGERAARAVQDVAVRATNLEYDLDAGRRGDRDDHVTSLICELTGAEAATVVNNNAAAVLLVLNTLALGREVPVSRGELVEIGDAFRIPDIMARSGAVLREVGTTNRTHLRDFENAIGEQTGCLMIVHTSNYVIEGFTATVPPRELAALAHKAEVPLVNDLGSGTLIDLTRFGLPHEPTVRDSIEEGADLVTFSGDKVLGGPQVGVIVGRRDLLEKIRRNPLRRALRVDKLRLAALAETLRLHRTPERLAEELPTFRALLRPLDEVAAQAERVAAVLRGTLPANLQVSTVPAKAQPGSGALPGQAIDSVAVAITARDGEVGLNDVEAACRRLETPVIGRINDDRLLLDMRGLQDEPGLLAALAGLPAALATAPSGGATA